MRYPARINLLMAAALVFCWCGPSCSSQSKLVDKSFTKKADVTGDGVQEEIHVHITGSSFSEPFKWSLTIFDKAGATLYQVERDDSSLDPFFNEEGYESDCSGYMSCKEKYYFYDLPSAIFEVAKPSSAAWGKDDFKTSSLQSTASAYLRHKGVPSDKISKVIKEMQTILSKPGFHTLGVPVSPVQGSPPMIWVPSLKEFVPYYEQ